MESKIIEYIKTEYDPEAVLLGGSRMKGRETEKSDWDLFLIAPRKGKKGFVEFEGERLDVVFKSWPDDNKVLTIPTGPLWPIKVVFDRSEGRLEKLLEKTKENFLEGPWIQHKELILERMQKMDSWKRKMEKYVTNPMVEFVFAGVFYEIAIQTWCEVHDMWSQSPAEALPIIEEKEKSFYDMLSGFVSSSGSQRVGCAEAILERLNSQVKIMSSNSN
jgi:predicted nucleotidyltransferase